MRSICNALGSIKTKWFEIGIQLGIRRKKLKEFKREDDPLSAVVDYWLTNVVEKAIPKSWHSIVAVLKSDHVGEPGLADEVSRKYCCQEITNEIEKGQTSSS